MYIEDTSTFLKTQINILSRSCQPTIIKQNKDEICAE